MAAFFRILAVVGRRPPASAAPTHSRDLMGVAVRFDSPDEGAPAPFLGRFVRF